MSINKNPGPWFKNQKHVLRISTLNIRSLQAHFQDVICDHTLLQSHVIALTETWVDPLQSSISNYKIPGFSALEASVGRGKGVVVYFDKCLQSVIVQSENFQAIRLQHNIDIIAVYASSGMCDAALSREIKGLIRTEARCSIILGDFNWDALKKSNRVTEMLLANGYTQLVTEPTHRQGSCLDQAFCNKPVLSVMVHSVYYSDHDAVCIVIEDEI
jgi:hypothetical protein